LNSSKSTKTNELQILLNTLDKFPLKKAATPSSFKIFLAQWAVPSYKISLLPLYIINLLLIVSRGYEINSENVVITYAINHLIKNPLYYPSFVPYFLDTSYNPK